MPANSNAFFSKSRRQITYKLLINQVYAGNYLCGTIRVQVSGMIDHVIYCGETVTNSVYLVNPRAYILCEVRVYGEFQSNLSIVSNPLIPIFKVQCDAKEFFNDLGMNERSFLWVLIKIT
jgi:hypothetical protein